MDMKKNIFNNNVLRLGWLIGFFEGDGNFQIHYEEIVTGKLKSIEGKQEQAPKNIKTSLGYSINISLSHLDKELLESIQKDLNGLGKIYVYPDRKEARLAIWKKDEVKWLIKNVFDVYPLITDYQKERYARLRYGILNNITLFNDYVELQNFKISSFVPTLESLLTIYSSAPQKEYLDNWILGIINSEGCFYTRPKKDGTYLLVFQIEHTDSRASAF